MISQMVDNILKDGHEVGFSSGDDGDLSGDETKAPIFVIKKDQEETKDDSAMGGVTREDENDHISDEHGGDYSEDEENELFV